MENDIAGRDKEEIIMSWEESTAESALPQIIFFSTSLHWVGYPSLVMSDPRMTSILESDLPSLVK